jgi:hypothetical protein
MQLLTQTLTTPALRTRALRTLLAAAQRERPTLPPRLYTLSSYALEQLQRCFTGLPARYAAEARGLARIPRNPDGVGRVPLPALRRWHTQLAELLPVAQRSRDPQWRRRAADLEDACSWLAQLLEG